MTLAELHQHRLAGRRPEHPVFMALWPELRRHIPDQTVEVSPGDCFSALTNLSVWVCCQSDQGDAALALIEKILAEAPYDLIFWVIDRGVAQNIVEHGVRTNTLAVPNDFLRPTMEQLKCK